MARSTLSFGMLWPTRSLDGAAQIAGCRSDRRRRLFAAMVISFDNLLKILPRLASMAPLKRLTFDHLLCPAIRADSMQLLIETCEFPNNTSPREWLARRGN